MHPKDARDTIGSRPSGRPLPPHDDNEGARLTALLERLATEVRKTYAQPYWVRAEISEFKVHSSGHAYLTLVEHGSDGMELSRVSARIWSRTLPRLQERFRKASGEELAAGIKVLIEVTVEFHPRWGLSLVIEDIDPSYTIGDMARKIEEIRNQLMEDGLYERNKTFAVPEDYERVAVIAPAGAAGLGDFLARTGPLAAHGLCAVEVFEAVFEGHHAWPSVVTAFAEVARRHAEAPFDALCVVRGGGSRASLDWMNELHIAKALCCSPLPVFTAIGHEKDTCILDELACQCFGTPSMAAGFIVDRVVESARSAEAAYRFILSEARSSVVKASHELDTAAWALNSHASFLCAEAERASYSLKGMLVERAESVLRMANIKTDAMMKDALSLSPKATLRRGYAVIKNAKGKLITSPIDLKATDTVTIVLAGGSITARIKN